MYDVETYIQWGKAERTVCVLTVFLNLLNFFLKHWGKDLFRYISELPLLAVLCIRIRNTCH